MQKIITVSLLLWLVCALGKPGGHKQRPNHNPATQQQESRNHADATQPQAPSFERQLSEPSGTGAATNQTNVTDYQPDPGPKLTDWLMVGLTLAYVCVSILIWCAVRRQASIAQDSARAALLNANSLINSERPWIVPKMLRDEKWLQDGPQNATGEPAGRHVIYFTLTFRNLGKTPAEITSFGATQTEKPWGQELPDDPDYRFVGTLQHQRILGPRESWRDSDCGWYIDTTNETAEQAIKTLKTRFWWYGMVEYRSLVDASTHETRFCYVYSQPLEDVIVGGPQEYTKYT